ncbi:polysaccharide biosynthesis protein [Psychrobacter sp. F1192]|uniref:Polysaccharide biosynthesis protein n=1 Tax=Psychrobacter coccoides TaxID=2818440 RepID=A0ABS3NP13_9GAMM|nr:nucleoside-diphosphate sugar epimerase/dehydratase [Psychrobacter coccoides]MBO1531152.1 polysaccharide biosynthesis protein [Psychrobacter coccoides]
MSNKQKPNNAYSVSKNADSQWYQRNARRLLALPRGVKRSILIGIDYLMSIVCLFFALSLRYGYIDNHISVSMLCLFALPPVIGLYYIGFYKGLSRIFSDTAMRKVLQLFVVLIIIYEVIYYFDTLAFIPRSVPILYLFFFFIWLWGIRLSIREVLELSKGKQRDRHGNIRENVIIYGVGSAGRELFEGLERSDKYRVVAFIDDDLEVAGGYLYGRRIYAANKVFELIDKRNISQIFLALPSASRARRRQIINDFSEVPVKIKQLPSLHEIADGKVTVSQMRPVNILDVLDRQTVEPDDVLLSKNIKGKNVLVTGAGGSIGSELCRQVIKNKPQCLILYELSEYALYVIHQELKALKASNIIDEDVKVVGMLGNVTNEEKLLKVFEEYKVDTVYHAAAYKHVPIVESNPFEGVINNAKGTYHCAYAAMQAEVETFVLISTDKAVRPTNVMGASKRLAELVCQGLSQMNTKTCFSMVRFGNVLGSSGSVIPLFTKQIEKGGPITVTHPEVTRYFMTIPEAASLVIQAGAMAKGGEVFVLDMGESVKIVDLAKRMILLTGYKLKDKKNPDGDIEIVFSGLRPGEKLYEELIIGDGNVQTTHHPLIRQAIEDSFPLMEIENMLSQLIHRAQPHDVEWLKQELTYFVEGYHEGTAIS